MGKLATTDSHRKNVLTALDTDTSLVRRTTATTQKERDRLYRYPGRDGHRATGGPDKCAAPFNYVVDAALFGEVTWM